MILKRFVSHSLRAVSPSLWQQIKYRQYLTATWGEREIHIIHRFVDPTRAALDIGVHLGMYTRHLAKFAKQVIGFEANPDSAKFAKRSLRGLATIEWVALSSERGSGYLRIPIEGGNGGEEALGTVSQQNTLGGMRYHSIVVPMKTLDEFDLPPIGFVKIDVEGHEEAVVAGAELLLKRDRPACMIEIEERHNPNCLTRLVKRFEEQEYRVMFYDGSILRSIAEFDPNTHQISGNRMYINNFIFIPLEFHLHYVRLCSS